ncbi:MAG: BACON domain-containing protein, partial [Acidobacteria bacterium]|nr:BACON domain-containing protein [Acidobacteriota bacterium]
MPWLTRVLMLTAAWNTLWPATTPNLIRNGDAESSAGSASCASAAAIPQWTTDGAMSVCLYGGTSDWPLTIPGPPNRGNNFFNGARVAETTISQVVDLGSYASDISGGTQGYTLRGYLGGWMSNGDSAVLKATFRNSSGAVLSSVQIGPVTAADRNNATALLLRSTSGTVPAAARSVFIELTITRSSGSDNDGAADNLEFLLSGSTGSCTYSIAPTSAQAAATASTGSLSVTTQAGCTWNAVSDSSWITVTSGASGAGNGSVAYSVAANSGAARTGTIVV